MQQNIKVDVIYYLSPSDFEMEFNLCGCCHMRLLNEKTKDRKEFVKALAKAVSRSKIMILCGPLFDDNGLINIVSTAIGKSTEVINNAEFGINYDDKINIIEGSIPLVTPEGLFGGCIIESGPQAIVVLSENKSVRKTIMNNLIHQYIYELSLLPENALTRAEEKEEQSEDIEETAPEVTGAETPAETQSEEKVEEQEKVEEPKENIEYEDISSVSDLAEETVETVNEEIEEAEQEETEPQPEEIQAESEEETEDSAEEESEEQASEQLDFANEFEKKVDNGKAMFSFVEEAESQVEEVAEETDDSEESDENSSQKEAPTSIPGIQMYIAPEQISIKKTADYAKNYIPSEKDTMFVSDEECEYEYDSDDENGNFRPMSKTSLFIILLVIVLCLIAVGLVYLMVYIPYSKGIDYSTYVHEIFGTASNV